MKTIAVGVLSACLSFVAGIAVAQVRGWQDLEVVHKQVQNAIHEMEHARAVHYYDKAGYAAKAEDHLREAEHSLSDGIKAAREESQK